MVSPNGHEAVTHVIKANLEPGRTIATRGYLITGENGGMEAEADGWVDEVDQ